mgnify:CR=1 FL=1
MTLKQAIKEADQVRVPVRIERGFTYHAMITKKEAKAIASDYLEEKSDRLMYWIIHCQGIASFVIKPGTGMKILYLGR